MARTKRKRNPFAPIPEQAAPTERIYKAAGYVRLSVEDSGRPGSDTLDGQKAFISGFVENQSNMELCGLFCDNGRTGTDFARPEFEKLMDAVRTGVIDCIVVKDLSRFGRNYKETGNYLERIFPFLGVRFIAINDNFDTLTAERSADGYIVPLKNLINEVYSKDISKKSGSALEQKQRNGEFIGAWAPYGYSKDPDNKNHLIVNEETAPVVKQIFRWRAEGISGIQIARKLNDAGIPSPSAYLYNTGAVKTEKYHDVPWQSQVLTKILAHQVYLGHMVQGKKKQSFYVGTRQVYTAESDWKIVKNTHEAIIDEETFRAVQAITKQKNDEYQARLGKFAHLEHSENMMQGLIFCANCNRPLVRYKSVSHGKKLWYTYICPGHAADPNRCDFVSIREDALMKIVFTALQKQIELAADMTAVIQRINESQAYKKSRSDADRRLDAARRALKRTQSLYDSLYQNYVEQLMTEQEYVTLKARYAAEADNAAQQIAVLEAELRQVKSYTPENPFLTNFTAFTAEKQMTREMAAALIERIDVDSNGNITIRFRFRDEFQALSEFMEGRVTV